MFSLTKWFDRWFSGEEAPEQDLRDENYEGRVEPPLPGDPPPTPEPPLDSWLWTPRLVTV